MSLIKKLPEYLSPDNLKIALYAITVIAAAWNSYNLYKENALHVTQKRQLKGLLTKVEHELQQQKAKFGVAKAELLNKNSTLKTQAAKYKTELDDTDQKFQAFVEEHNLQLQEFRHDIHVLNQTIRALKSNPPKTEVIIEDGSCEENTKVAYSFTDRYKRLNFTTPNCLVPGGEQYTLNQVFSIYGEVYRQANGLLKVSALKLRELDPRNNSKVLAVASLIKSDFKYLAEPISVQHKYDSFSFGLAVDRRLKLNISANYTLYNYKNLYLNAGAVVTNDLDLHPQMAVVYRPTFLSKPVNIGAHLGAGYSFQNSATYSLGLSFFVW